MKPTYLKKRGRCQYCHEPILKGTPVARQSFRSPAGYWITVSFHWRPCFIEKIDKWFKTHLFEPMKSSRRKSGHHKLRRSKLSLRNYHIKKGNEVRVEEITREIKALEVI